MRDGVTLNQERRKNSVIISTEFSKLNNLEAYLKLPGNFPITKLKFKYQAKGDIAEPLVARDIKDLLVQGGNGNSQNKTESNNKAKVISTNVESSDKTKVIPEKVKDVITTVAKTLDKNVQLVTGPLDY